jgi:hypothetical protein
MLVQRFDKLGVASKHTFYGSELLGRATQTTHQNCMVEKHAQSSVKM